MDLPPSYEEATAAAPPAYNNNVVKVIDSRLENTSADKATFVVKEGFQNVNYNVLTSSSHSDQSTNFNLNNIAQHVARDPRLVVVGTFTITLNLTNGTGAPVKAIQADNFGFKQFPFNRIISSLQHQINQASYTLNSSEILSEIGRVNLLPQDMNFYPNTMPDCIDSYANATGSLLNPLQPYDASSPQGDGVFKPRTTRYSVVGNSIAAGGTSDVVITVQVYEPLMSPFCNITGKDSSSLWGINGEIINLTYLTDKFNNMCGYYAPAGLTLNSSTVSLGNQLQLNCIYLTAHQEYMDKIPRSSIYHYNDYVVFSNTLGPCGAKTTLSSQSSQVVQFSQIPSKILVYARLANSSRTAATPDKYLRINRLTAQWESGAPQLSSASRDQLYDISRRNGLSLSREHFNQDVLNRTAVEGGSPALYGCGSVLVLDPCLDLGLAAGNSVGSRGRYVFQITGLDVENNTDIAFPQVQLFIVGVNSGVLERVATEYRNFNLSLSTRILEQARNISPVGLVEFQSAKVANSFLSGGSIGDWFKKAASMVRAAIPTIQRGIEFGMKHKGEIGDIVSQGRKVLGVGEGVMLGGEGVKYGKLKRKMYYN